VYAYDLMNEPHDMGLGNWKTISQAVVDAIRVTAPPFSPQTVAREYARFLNRYGLTSVSSDHYGGEFAVELFANEGIRLEQTAQSKSSIYEAFLPLLNSGRAELLDNDRLRGQLLGLERRSGRTGRDSIDHPVGGHDDAINAVAGALLLAGVSENTRTIMQFESLGRTEQAPGTDSPFVRVAVDDMAKELLLPDVALGVARLMPELAPHEESAGEKWLNRCRAIGMDWELNDAKTGIRLKQYPVPLPFEWLRHGSIHRQIEQDIRLHLMALDKGAFL